MKHHAFKLVTACLSLCPALASAQWQLNGTPICVATSSQSHAAICSDGAGGAIVAWQDSRNPERMEIFAQRVSGSGVALWATDGVVICSAEGSRYDPVIVADGAGGAIIAWVDERALFLRIFAQRVNPLGNVVWTTDGVSVSSASGHRTWPRLVSDGSGGAIISWLDLRSSNFDVYTQRLDGAGVPQWTPGGAPVCTAANGQEASDLVSDGAGGAIIAWQDARVGPGIDIYAQRIDALGAPQWAENGITLCTAASNQWLPQLATDGANGAIVVWYDSRLGSVLDIYAQRVSATGAPQWVADGVVICDAINNQQLSRIVSDGGGGAVMAWEDNRSGTNYDVYAQRVNGLGVVQWPANGVAISTATNHQTDLRMVSDGTGGAIVAFDHARPNDHDIYAQRVDATGAPQWITNGVPIASATDAEQTLPVITTDGVGGAIIAWQSYDYFAGDSDIYALRHPLPPTPVGPTPVPLSLQVLPNHPNPFNTSTSVDVYLPTATDIAIDIYDVLGRRVRHLALTSEGGSWRRVYIDAHDEAGQLLSSGVYFCRISARGESITRKMVIAR